MIMLGQSDDDLKLLSQDKLEHSIKQAAQKSTLIVDFDETLFLLNSSAEYLNSLQPRLLAALVLKILSFLKPWRFLIRSGKDSEVRDWFLIFVTTLIFPWNFFLWRKKAKRLGQEYTNQELSSEFNNNNDVEIIVATLGFKFIVEPILNFMPVKYDKLIACRFWQGGKDRQEGKLAILEKSLGQEKLSSAIVITDSLTDAPLLKVAAQPFLITWKNAKYNPPMADIYLPFIYLSTIKRPKESYLLRAIIGDDLPLLWLAFSFLSSSFFGHGIAIGCLLISFWCIYEFGYYENDLVAEKYEKEPRLSQDYQTYKKTITWWQPWLWSLVCGEIGIIFLVGSKIANSLFDFSWLLNTPELLNDISLPSLYWVGFLIVSRLCFWLYNYVNKKTRIWLYLLLQIIRYCGFLAVTTTNVVGITVLLSQMFARTVSYIVYRYSGGTQKDWPKLPEQFVRLLLFITMIGGMSVAISNFSLVIGIHTLVVLGWFTFRASKQVFKIINNARFIWQDGGN